MTANIEVITYKKKAKGKKEVKIKLVPNPIVSIG